MRVLLIATLFLCGCQSPKIIDLTNEREPVGVSSNAVDFTR